MKKSYLLSTVLLVLTVSTTFSFYKTFQTLPRNMAVNTEAKITAGEIVNLIKQNVTCVWKDETVDTFKSGNPNDSVNGILVTFMATMEVLKKAKELGYNFIITHEPTFYDHLDANPNLANDHVVLEKKKFIEENDLIIWRFHDHWHCTEPDGIYVGMTNFFGWRNNLVDGTWKYFTFPEQTVQQFANDITGKFDKITVRIVGNPEMKFTRAGFIAGAPGSVAQIKMLQEDRVEVLIAGETREWETVEYVRDASNQGRKKALVLLGHANSEEAGMHYCAQWLQSFVNDVPIKFVSANDPFWTVY